MTRERLDPRRPGRDPPADRREPRAPPGVGRVPGVERVDPDRQADRPQEPRCRSASWERSCSRCTPPARTVYVPHLFESYATRYGVIGAVFAMISALFCVMVVVVASAALGREVGDELARIRKRRAASRRRDQAGMGRRHRRGALEVGGPARADRPPPRQGRVDEPDRRRAARRGRRLGADAAHAARLRPARGARDPVARHAALDLPRGGPRARARPGRRRARAARLEARQGGAGGVRAAVRLGLRARRAGRRPGLGPDRRVRPQRCRSTGTS